MKKLIVANWKCNPDSIGRAVVLAKKIEKFIGKSKAEMVIAPPLPFLYQVGAALTKSKLGAQDAFWGDLGAYTGEVSWRQLKDAKVSYAIIGHSERRRLLNETDNMINKKILAVISAGIIPILCVGEPWVVRGRGIAAAKKFVENQLKQDLKGIKKRAKLVVAYEPIWAISTSGLGRADDPKESVMMIDFIRKILTSRFRILNSRILYGGSINGANASSFLEKNEIDGVLVGGASLKPEEFERIVSGV